MAQINFSISEAKYLIGGIAGTAKQAAQTAGITAIRDAWYYDRLESLKAADNDEDWLAVNTLKADGVLSMDTDTLINSTNNPELANNIILRVPSAEAVIEIIGARLTISPENTIVRTPLINKAGTVKEYLQASDYRVTIDGNLIRDSHIKFPVEAMKRLLKVLKQAEAIRVSNAKLSFFDIDQLVFS